MNKTKILFVCHGNICRSPMAEFLMKDIVKKAHLENAFEISSAATSTEELGNGIYPPARACLASHNVPFSQHYARQIKRSDYDYYDLIIGLDSYNVKNIIAFFGSDPDNKVSMLNDFSVEDPWYTDNFEKVFCEIEQGCKCLFCRLQEKGL